MSVDKPEMLTSILAKVIQKFFLTSVEFETSVCVSGNLCLLVDYSRPLSVQVKERLSKCGDVFEVNSNTHHTVLEVPGILPESEVKVEEDVKPTLGEILMTANTHDEGSSFLDTGISGASETERESGSDSKSMLGQFIEDKMKENPPESINSSSTTLRIKKKSKTSKRNHFKNTNRKDKFNVHPKSPLPFPKTDDQHNKPEPSYRNRPDTKSKLHASQDIVAKYKKSREKCSKQSLHVSAKKKKSQKSPKRGRNIASKTGYHSLKEDGRKILPKTPTLFRSVNKKGRGRPKKPLSGVNNAGIKICSTGKRGRGRPRKIEMFDQKMKKQPSLNVEGIFHGDRIENPPSDNVNSYNCGGDPSIKEDQFLSSALSTQKCERETKNLQNKYKELTCLDSFDFEIDIDRLLYDHQYFCRHEQACSLVDGAVLCSSSVKDGTGAGSHSISKKKRGRPRKIQIDDFSPKNIMANEPGKINNNLFSPEKTILKKRGRGRPRKLEMKMSQPILISNIEGNNDGQFDPEVIDLDNV